MKTQFGDLVATYEEHGLEHISESSGWFLSGWNDHHYADMEEACAILAHVQLNEMNKGIKQLEDGSSLEVATFSYDACTMQSVITFEEDHRIRVDWFFTPFRIDEEKGKKIEPENPDNVVGIAKQKDKGENKK